MFRFAQDLKSKNENQRNKAAKELHDYVSNDLRECSQVFFIFKYCFEMNNNRYIFLNITCYKIMLFS